jgi:hypothetical protein
MGSSFNLNKDNSLRVPIRTNSGNKYYRILQLLAFYKPFSTLGVREMEVLALIWGEYKGANTDKRIKYGYIFESAEFKNSVCEKLHIEKTNYNNVIKNLRKKGFLDKKSIPENYEKWIDGLKDNIIFSFIDES